VKELSSRRKGGFMENGGMIRALSQEYYADNGPLKVIFSAN
jgi:hypothetical protein